MCWFSLILIFFLTYYSYKIKGKKICVPDIHVFYPMITLPHFYVQHLKKRKRVTSCILVSITNMLQKYQQKHLHHHFLPRAPPWTPCRDLASRRADILTLFSFLQDVRVSHCHMKLKQVSYFKGCLHIFDTSGSETKKTPLVANVKHAIFEPLIK